MADQYVSRTKVFHHFRRDFTGECPGRFGMDVLRADRQPTALVRSITVDRYAIGGNTRTSVFGTFS